MATVQNAAASGLPILILREGTKQNNGREAQRNNIVAAIRTFLLKEDKQFIMGLQTGRTYKP